MLFRFNNIIMELSVTELSKLLNVSPDTIERWIRQGKFPVSRKGSNYRFKLKELESWAKKNNIRLELKEKNSQNNSQKKNDDVAVCLYKALENGGACHNVNGDDVADVLESALEKIDGVPEDQKITLHSQLMERESALSTGIGKGVAIPHPRQPQTYLDQPLVSVCFLSNPIDYKALDGKPVSVLFFILCPDLKMHLQILSAISACLKNSSFVDLLNQQPAIDSILDKIKSIQDTGSI